LMRATVKLEGFAELDRAMASLTRATAANTMRRALKEAAEPMAAAARRMAPVDDYQLVEAIEVSTKAKGASARGAFMAALRSTGSRTAAGAAAKAAGGGSFVSMYVGPTERAPHAHFQEFGVSHHAPQPYMRPAFDAEAQPTINRLKVALAEQINKAVARAAAKAARG